MWIATPYVGSPYGRCLCPPPVDSLWRGRRRGHTLAPIRKLVGVVGTHHFLFRPVSSAEVCPRCCSDGALHGLLLCPPLCSRKGGATAGGLGPQHVVAPPEIGRFTELCAGGSLCSGDDESWTGKRCHTRSRCEQCFSEENSAMAKEIRTHAGRFLQHGTCAPSTVS